MIAIVLPKADDRILSALTFQKNKKFKVYLVTGDADDYPTLNVQHGSWSQVKERFVCILEPGAVPDPHFVCKINWTTKMHPKFDVYHVNVEGEEAFPRKASAKKVFQLAVFDGVKAPLSSFVFRANTLRAKAVFRADGTLNTLPTVLSCAAARPVRNIWRGKLEWKAPEYSESEKDFRERLDLLRWTEDFFGDDDYPLSVGNQLGLFAAAVAKLKPFHTEDELKEIMGGFLVSQGTIRRMRALSALKDALKGSE